MNTVIDIPPTPPQLAIVPSVSVMSPILGVSADQWKTFRATMSDPANLHRESDTGHLGLYRFGIPRLAELGLLAGLRRDPTNPKRWKAGWIPWLTMAGFLSSAPAQHEMFNQSCANFVFDIRPTSMVGRTIDGIATTLSGLVAVAHRAGFRGLQSWIVRRDDRQRFPNTTAAFRAANGAF